MSSRFRTAWCLVFALVFIGTAGAAPTATAEAESVSAFGIFDRGARCMIWYSGAPQLEGLHQYLSGRLTESRVETALWDSSDGSDGSDLPGVQSNQPYDFLVLAANTKPQLATWRMIAPPAHVVLSVWPEGDDVRFEITLTLGLTAQPIPRVVDGQSAGQLLDVLTQIESAGDANSAIQPEDRNAQPEGGEAQQDEGPTDVPPVEIRRAQTNRLKALVSCIWVALKDLDLTWSVTVGPDGKLQSITFTGNSLPVLYQILACF